MLKHYYSRRYNKSVALFKFRFKIIQYIIENYEVFIFDHLKQRIKKYTYNPYLYNYI